MNRFLIVLCLLFSQLIFAQTADELYNESKDLLQKNQAKTALERINKAIELDNRRAEFFVAQAYIFIGLQRYQDASLSYEKAVILLPDHYSTLAPYAMFLMALNRHDQATPFLEKAVLSCQNQDTLRMLYNNLAAAYQKSRNMPQAERVLKICYGFDSNNVVTLNNLAMLYQAQKRYTDALVYLQKVLQLDTTAVYSYGNIGFVYQAMNEHARAVPFFDKAIELSEDPELTGVSYCNRGYSKLKLGQKKAALEDLNKSIELYEINSYAWRVRGEVYLALKKKKKACENWETAIKLRYTEQWGDEAVNLQRQHCK